MICLCTLWLCQAQIALQAEDRSPSSSRFISFLESVPPASGEMAFSVTEYYSGNPPSKLPTPQTNTFYAIWRGTDIFIGDLPGLFKGTNSVTSLLVGRQGNLLWDAHGTQLDLYVKTNKADLYVPATDNNQVTFFVDDARQRIRTILKGGFDFSNMNWIGTHLSADCEGTKVSADLDFNATPPRLSGSAGNGTVSGAMRVDYFAFGTLNDYLYPRRYDTYTKLSDEKVFKRTRSIEITEFKTPLISQDSNIFSPTAHISTNYFGSYLYVSNTQYYVTTNNQLVRVHQALLSQIAHPFALFVKLIVVLSLTFLPLALWLRQKFINKTEQQ